MARMFPVLDATGLKDLQSRAEAVIYEACRDKLRPGVLVVHSLALIRLAENGTRQDGEADFVVFDPARGVLFIEVKGGGVSFDPQTGKWTSTGRTGIRPIKDPFRQATSQKHALIEYMRRNTLGAKLKMSRILFGHAVAFPDVGDVGQIRLPSSPKAIVAGRLDIQEIHRWIEVAFDYWAGNASHDPLGQSGVALCEKMFCSPIQVKPLLSSELEAEEAKRIELTRQQARLLRALGMRRRAIICGGAGTGKTLLALERARETAASGNNTLLLCYNRALSDYLKVAAFGVHGLHAMTFHQLCDWRIKVARTEVGKDFLEKAERDYPNKDLFNVQLPYALANAVDETRLRFDAIIVDEAQDFRRDFWFPLEMLLSDSESSLLYAFLDHNQAIYAGVPWPPIQDEPFLLTVNCRNTRFIHDAAYKFYSGILTDHPEIDGAPIEELLASSPTAQATRIASKITSLIVEEKVSAGDIAVLVVKDHKEPIYHAISTQPLPSGTAWKIETHRVPSSIIVDTVSRFKGLEAAVVFLCGFETALADADRELLYVGLSRAKSRVYLTGSQASIGRFLH